METKNKKLLTSIIYSIIITLFMILVMATNMFKGLDNLTYDHIYEKENTYSEEIVIVGIDDKTLSNLGAFTPSYRSYFADVIDKINTYNPAVIGVDILFTGVNVDNPEYDTKLTTAATNTKNIVFAAEFKSGDKIVDDMHEKDITYTLPYDELYNEIGDESLGFVNVISDGDSVVRHARVSAKLNDTYYSSFGEQIYKKYANEMDLDYSGYVANREYLVNYNGYPEQGYEVVSFYDVYNNINLYSDLFEDKIVLIGWYATGNASKDRTDEYYTPIAHKTHMFGVELHANVINNIMNDMFVQDAAKTGQYIINIIIMLAIIFIISRFGFMWASITAAASIIFEFLFGLIMYNAFGIFYPTTGIMVVIAIGYVVIVVYNYVRERLEKGAVLKTFKQYMAPQVVEAFLKDNKQSSNLVGERRDVACLFVDIRGFTRMSETLVDPVKVVKILNDYLGMTTKQIFDNDGMLDKFIGDACMAIFNAPFDIEDYEFKAIKAGLGIVKYGEPIAKQVFEDYGITIGFGVGVNCGEAIIGNIGCDFRKDYTGIGDTINTASRLESNAKGGQVIISEETLNRVDSNGKYKLKNRLIVEENGYLNLKGKAKPVLTYNVIGIKEGNNEETVNDSKD
ncbi:MAG: adenylate/guanylate cyclase domain-containing protein [Acholeplasmatales bacterium]|nr:adenylate/guanylate cyclase domain-containing protein [Acholeplasmatales bacterium]